MIGTHSLVICSSKKAKMLETYCWRLNYLKCDVDFRGLGLQSLLQLSEKTYWKITTFFLGEQISIFLLHDPPGRKKYKIMR